jgi:hypothetical protein
MSTKTISVAEARRAYEEAKAEERRAWWLHCEAQGEVTKAKNNLLEAMKREGIDEHA